jgi:hypothetical protein
MPEIYIKCDTGNSDSAVLWAAVIGGIFSVITGIIKVMLGYCVSKNKP